MKGPKISPRPSSLIGFQTTGYCLRVSTERRHFPILEGMRSSRKLTSLDGLRATPVIADVDDWNRNQTRELMGDRLRRYQSRYVW